MLTIYYTFFLILFFAVIFIIIHAATLAEQCQKNSGRYQVGTWSLNYPDSFVPIPMVRIGEASEMNLLLSSIIIHLFIMDNDTVFFTCYTISNKFELSYEINPFLTKKSCLILLFTQKILTRL